MTSNAATLGPRGAGHVLGVIELHIETLFEAGGKSLPRRIVAIHTRVTDRTHRHVRRRKLRQMTSGAVFVAGKDRLGRVVIAMMTSRTRYRRVTLTSVKKFRVVLGKGKRRKQKGKSKKEKGKRKDNPWHGLPKGQVGSRKPLYESLHFAFLLFPFALLYCTAAS